MEGSESIHRAPAPDLALHLQQMRRDDRRPPLKKRPRKVDDSDQVELHDEKIILHPNLQEGDDTPHLDISA